MGRSFKYQQEKVLGIMFGTFVGDVLGVKFEGQMPDQIPSLSIDFLAENAVGFYTDDTQMTISVLEELVEHGMINPCSLQQRFQRRFSLWRGYGGGMLEVIECWLRGMETVKAANMVYGGNGNFGDGAATRIAPLSAYFGLDERDKLIEQVTICSKITHLHPYGISGAILQAYAVLLALNDVPVEKWLDYFFELPIDSACKIRLASLKTALNSKASSRECARIIGNSSEAMQAVLAAICSVIRNSQSFVDTIFYAIGMGGDTDTIAAMAGAIIGAKLGYSKIPEKWINSLENDFEGKDFVVDLVSRGYENRRGEDSNLR
ncbi:MAG: ADP-ribosylglycohydrolase family protein [Fibrobacter sp.]|nr:ADP-ribosylglycohydrolase family protein [Fibrobacter sp.]